MQATKTENNLTINENTTVKALSECLSNNEKAEIIKSKDGTVLIYKTAIKRKELLRINYS